MTMIPFMFMVLQVIIPGGTNQIINGSFYNISSFTGLFTDTNNATHGFEGIVIFFILFMVFLGAASFKMKLIDAATASSLLCLLISVLLQQIGLVGNSVPVLFLGATMLFGFISLMSGWTKPYD